MNHKFEEEYKIDDTAKFGFKVFSTLKSKYENMHPLRMNLIDAPGAMTRDSRGVDFYFDKCNVILIVMDVTLDFVPDKIDKHTQFVLQQVAQHHESIHNFDMIEPFICHVFTKQDRMNPEVKKKRERDIRRLAKLGTIGNYLFVSAKTGEGMDFLKKAIFDCDIKNHGERVRPYDPEHEKRKREMLAKMGKSGKEVIEEEDLDSDSDDGGKMKRATSHAMTNKRNTVDKFGLSKSVGGSKLRGLDDFVFDSGNMK